MGPQKKTRRSQSMTPVQVILIAIFGLTTLILPACQKAKYSKEGRTHEVRNLPDQDSVRPSTPPSFATSPQDLYQKRPQEIAVPYGSEDDENDESNHDDDTGGSPDPQPAETITTVETIPPEWIPYYSHPSTATQALAFDPPKYVFTPETLAPCQQQATCVPTAPAPAPEPVPTPSPEPSPCSQTSNPCDTTPLPEPQPEEPATPPTPASPPSSPKVSTHREEFYQPDSPLTNKVDILFVMDTSPSVYYERKDIVKNIPELIKNLPGINSSTSENDFDYKIAVLPAHSPDSDLSGLLFSASTNDPKVLGNKGSQAMTIQEISKALEYKIINLRKETGNDAGEMGLLSLYDFLGGPSAQDLRRQNEFLRSGAALLVMFVSDENDICYHYKPGERPHYDEKTHKNAPAVTMFGIPGFDPAEKNAFDRHCGKLGEQPEAKVLAQLKKVKGDDPLILSGIIYQDEQWVKTAQKRKGKKDQYPDENEVGHGYLDLIHMANSAAAELGKEQFATAMGLIGKIAHHKMTFNNQFVLKESGTVAFSQRRDNTVRPLMKITITRQHGGTPIDSKAYSFSVQDKTVTIKPESKKGVSPYEPQPGDQIVIEWQSATDSGGSSANSAPAPTPPAPSQPPIESPENSDDSNTGKVTTTTTISPTPSSLESTAAPSQSQLPPATPDHPAPIVNGSVWSANPNNRQRPTSPTSPTPTPSSRQQSGQNLDPTSPRYDIAPGSGGDR